MILYLFVQREHARLDSMVLLLMKLDQLDQEIENALSATSSMDSTPTPHRRQLLVRDVISCLASLANSLTVPKWSVRGIAMSMDSRHQSSTDEMCFVFTFMELICIK